MVVLVAVVLAVALAAVVVAVVAAVAWAPTAPSLLLSSLHHCHLR